MTASKIICPACGSDQEETDTCRRCGVHVQSFLDELKNEAAAMAGSEPRCEMESMICPNCGFEQECADICQKCGVVIRKFLEEQIREIEMLEAAESAPCETRESRAAAFLKDFGAGPDQWKRLIARWFRKAASLFTQLLLAVVATALLYTGFLFGLARLWEIYLSTHVGRTFFKQFKEKSLFIQGLFDANPIIPALEWSAIALAACLIVAFCIRITFIARYFYQGRGLVYKLAVWGIGCAIAAMAAGVQVKPFSFQASFALGIFPAFTLFMPVFRFVFHVTPEPDIKRLYDHLSVVLKHRKLRSAIQRAEAEGFAESDDPDGNAV